VCVCACVPLMSSFPGYHSPPFAPSHTPLLADSVDGIQSSVRLVMCVFLPRCGFSAWRGVASSLCLGAKKKNKKRLTLEATPGEPLQRGWDSGLAGGRESLEVQQQQVAALSKPGGFRMPRYWKAFLLQPLLPSLLPCSRRRSWIL
jgi:hypothetical protein